MEMRGRWYDTNAAVLTSESRRSGDFVMACLNTSMVAVDKILVVISLEP